MKDLEDRFRRTKMPVIGVLEIINGIQKQEEIIKQIIKENFPEMMESTSFQIKIAH